jgi:hypothetical protein
MLLHRALLHVVCGLLLALPAWANTYGCRTQDCCKDHCKKAGYCCNELISQSSNHMFSCLQGCAMRVAGEDKETVLGRCKSADSAGPCSFTHASLGTMNLCGTCSDSDAPGADKTKCAFGVATQSACEFGVGAVWELSEQHGWIFLFLGSVAAAIYIGGGMLRGGGFRKHPHERHFTEIAGLVQDGVAFVRSGGKGYKRLGAVRPSSSGHSPGPSSPQKKVKEKQKKKEKQKSPKNKKSKTSKAESSKGGGGDSGSSASVAAVSDGFSGLLLEERDVGANVHSSQAKVKVVSLT